MADDSYSHIYNIPRPLHSHSTTTYPPKCPVPVHIPEHPISHTHTALCHSYPAQSSSSMPDTPPQLPPRNWSMSCSSSPKPVMKRSLSEITPSQSLPSVGNGASPASTPTKSRWGSPKHLSRFGSFKGKGVKSVMAVKSLLNQAKHRFSDDTAQSSNGSTDALSLSDQHSIQFDLSPAGSEEDLSSLTSKFLTLGLSRIILVVTHTTG